MAVGNAPNILAASIAASQPVPAGMRTGVVTAVGTILSNGATGVTVDVSGASMDLPFASSYAPATGDIVNINKTGNSWMVLGPTGTVVNGSNPSRGWLSIAVLGAASIGPTSGTTELEIPNLILPGVNLYPDRTYMIHVGLSCTQSVASDRFVIQAHQGGFTGPAITNANFVTGTTLQDWEYFEWPWSPSSRLVNTNIRFGVARNSGTGTLSVQGNPGGSVTRTWSGIEDISSDSILRTGV